MTTLGMTGLGWFAIALGGALGAMARFAMSHHSYQLWGREFPWGTVMVNVLGSLVMGFVVILLVDKFAISIEWRAFVMVGFLGAFTTFSTFSFETMEYLEMGEINKAMLNIGLSLIGCLVAVWLGFYAGRKLLGD